MMRLSPCRVLALLAVLACLLAGTGQAQKTEPEPGKVNKGAPADPGTAPPGKESDAPLTDYKLPPNAFIIIADSIGKAQKLIPKGFYITPEKYQEYQELEAKIKQLEGQLKPKKLKPHRCQLSGHLEGDFVELEAKYLLITAQPNSQVALGCNGAYLVKADLEGQEAFVVASTEGFVVQVPKAGNHNLTMTLKVHVKTVRDEGPGGGQERSIVLGVPGAAVLPPLELKLPAEIKALRWNDLLQKKPPTDGDNDPWKIPLVGDPERSSLKVSWRETTAGPGKGSMVAANWDVAVHLLKKQCKSTARLTLRDPRGKGTDWQILVPKSATVSVKDADPAYTINIEKSPGAVALAHITGPPAQQLEIQVHQVQDRLPGKKIPVGPFLVFGVDLQEATYDIVAAPDVMQGQRISYYKHLDLRSVDFPDDAKKKPADVVDRFKAWDLMPGPPAAYQPAVAAKIPPHFDLELKPLEAQVETWVEHTLRIQPAAQGWYLLTITKIHATPLFGVDFLDVQLPRPAPAWVPPVFPGPLSMLTNPLEAVAWLGLEGSWPVQPLKEFADFQVMGEGPAQDAVLLPGADKAGVRRIDLKRLQTSATPFIVTLTRKYAIAPQTQQVQVELPRPVSLSDKGAKVSVTMEDDGLELVNADHNATGIQYQKQVLTSSWNAAPSVVTLAWQPYQIELPVNITADVSLQPHVAKVREQIEFDLDHLGKTKSLTGPSGAWPLRLTTPIGVRNLHVVSGGKLLGWHPGQGFALIAVQGKTPPVLQYDFALPMKEHAMGGQQDVDLPLLWPEQATRAATKVRIWSMAGVMSALPRQEQVKAVWVDTGPEDVAGKDKLPVLVVQSDRLDPRLTIQIDSTAQAPLAGVLVDRALMQVEFKEDGKRHFRARFLISRLDTDALELRLPLPAAQLKPGLAIRLNGKLITAKETSDDLVVRLLVNPKHYTHPVILDISFNLDAVDTSWPPVEHLLLQAPRLIGSAQVERIRWQLATPSGLVPLVLGGTDYAAPHWQWEGWLFAPVSSTSTAELEQWLSLLPGAGESNPAGTVFWGGGTGTVRVMLVSRQLWLLVCSAVALMLGLGASYLPWKRLWSWALIAGFALSLAIVHVLHPGLLPAVFYGIQPGMAVLFTVLLLQWLVHERYRRQMLFMPGFTRMRAGSSIVRREGPAGRAPSTIDVPAVGSKVGSSHAEP